MKKLLLLFALTFSICACGTKQDSTTTKQTDQIVQTFTNEQIIKREITKIGDNKYFVISYNHYDMYISVSYYIVEFVGDEMIITRLYD